MTIYFTVMNYEEEEDYTVPSDEELWEMMFPDEDSMPDNGDDFWTGK